MSALAQSISVKRPITTRRLYFILSSNYRAWTLCKCIFCLYHLITERTISQKLRQGGTAWHVCVLNYFYERSPLWKSVREANNHVNDDEDNADDDQLTVDLEGAPTTERTVSFEPMESRHLASLPLLRSRLVKLLKNCPNNTHAHQNILLKLVCGLKCSILRELMCHGRLSGLSPSQHPR